MAYTPSQVFGHQPLISCGIQRRTTNILKGTAHNNRTEKQNTNTSGCVTAEDISIFQNQQLFQLLIGWRDWRRKPAIFPFDEINLNTKNISYGYETHTRFSSTLCRSKPRASRWSHKNNHYLQILNRLLCVVVAIGYMLVIFSGVFSVHAQSPHLTSSFIRHGSGSETKIIANLTSSNGIYNNQRKDIIGQDLNQESSLDNKPITDDGGCSACRLRQKVEDLSIDSFKTHILQRLHLKQPPNVTTPVVADHVLRKFYSDYGYRYIRLRPYTNPTSSSFAVSDADDRMQGDEPARPQTSQRHHHHPGRRQGPNDRHPEAETVIYEDEFGEYEVDEQYYDSPYHSESSSRWRHQRSGKYGNKANNWHSTGEFLDDYETDNYHEENYDELQDLDESNDDTGENDDKPPYIDPFYSSTHSMYAFPKG